jgi:hypothetical protein
MPGSEMPEPYIFEYGGWTFVQAVKHCELKSRIRMNSDTAKAVVTVRSGLLRDWTTKSFVDLVGTVPTYIKNSSNSESGATDFY